MPPTLPLRPALDRLYLAFNAPDSAVDPIHIVRRYPRAEDQEIVAFCAAALAFGRVSSVMQSIERLLTIMRGGEAPLEPPDLRPRDTRLAELQRGARRRGPSGMSPAAFVRQFDPRRDGRAFAGFVHRWTRADDVVALLWVLRQMLDRSGSIEAFFADGLDEGAEDIGPAIESFSTRALALDLRAAYGRVPKRPGVAYFFPRPSAGSGCKRLNLFLRWMVRRDALDLGIWSRVPAAKLVVPLDTHVIRVGRCLGLTQYTSPGWKMAQDITASLRRLDADDPVKYDFAMCHLGMMDACGFERAKRDSQCPLKGVCRPRARRRRPSRRPSAPR
jgi:uncharacterized protein (TIGR02757 family)